MSAERAVMRPQRPAYVGEFHSLGLQWGAPAGSDDECGFVFSDERQRVFQRQGHVPVSMVPIVLEENLRDTKQIADTFSPLGTWRMRTRGSEGPPVRFVPCAAQDALSLADDQIDLLLQQGWAPEHLALLTTGRRHPEQVARQERGQREYWKTFWDAEQVFFGHVLGFKWLERPVVVLAVNRFGSDERAREKLYVGLSRARDLLVVCGDPEDIEGVGGHALLQRLLR